MHQWMQIMHRGGTFNITYILLLTAIHCAVATAKNPSGSWMDHFMEKKAFSFHVCFIVLKLVIPQTNILFIWS